MKKNWIIFGTTRKRSTASLNIDNTVVLFGVLSGRLQLLLHLREHVLHPADLLVLLQEQPVRLGDVRLVGGGVALQLPERKTKSLVYVDAGHTRACA